MHCLRVVQDVIFSPLPGPKVLFRAMQIRETRPPAVHARWHDRRDGLRDLHPNIHLHADHKTSPALFRVPTAGGKSARMTDLCITRRLCGSVVAPHASRFARGGGVFPLSASATGAPGLPQPL
jgi:hypothetical protein